MIEGFKDFIKSGEMTISLGVAVDLFEPEEQQMMLNGLDGNYNANQINRMIQNQTYDLAKAPFKLEDKTLVPHVGACTLCPFNAANQGNLFGDNNMICTKSTCYKTKKLKSFFNLLEWGKKDNILLIPNIRKYSIGNENNQLVMSQMEERGFEVYLLDDVKTLEKPIKPSIEVIKEEWSFDNPTDEEIQEEFDSEMEYYNEELETYNAADKNGFVRGILFSTESYRHNNILVKIIEKSEGNSDVRSISLEKRRMEDCTPEEQIIKIKARETRKKQIENNRQFEEVVKVVRETNYINTKKALSVDEMVAFSLSLYQNNIHYYD